MTEIDKRQPAGLTAPIYRSSSSTVKSPTPTGGEVPPAKYTGKDPAPKRDYVR